MKTSVLSTLIGAGCLLIANTGPAEAQANRTWVSGTGDDVNVSSNCSRTLPCKTFAGAITATNAGGEMNCLDSGAFGQVNINKSISIICEGVIGGVLVGATNGITINDAGAGTAVVVLKGLDIDGIGTGLSGIRFLSGAALHVKDSVIRNFNGSPGYGIQFAPTAGALSRLFVSDSLIINNGLGANEGGIVVQPSGSVSVRVVLDRVRVLGNTNGILALGSGSQPIIVQIRDSVVAGNSTHGMAAIATSSGLTALVIDRTSATLNGGDGIRSQGTGALVHVGSSTVIGNIGGLIAVSGGSILSYQDNKASGNGADGGPTGVLTMK
jgi:hypothetical protein